MRYRLDVVAPSARDAVRYAGGWIYDRVMAGWDVTVLLGRDDDLRALHILGADTLDLEAVLVAWDRRPHPQSVAVAAEMFDRDPRVLAHVRNALDHGGTEVTLWGEHVPAELDQTVSCVRHHLSAAAKAFKARALSAIDDPGARSVGNTEVFRCGMLVSVAADLVPAS
ncbi:hypothetical protein [Mycobacterium sp. NAZ190054]|uniref:hypothetical protein n=1 Tax=Mycobacterium sp. NAZ190054 TaxID=1747766 RepID=UPI000797D4BF|nr:hypothetical protein [Mycobacterium sp. NAZ190054]KWX66949.1 hypothetical protein ASJ79_05275 [Mycobacterium sp. NAZ190054]